MSLIIARRGRSGINQMSDFFELVGGSTEGMRETGRLREGGEIGCRPVDVRSSRIFKEGGNTMPAASSGTIMPP